MTIHMMTMACPSIQDLAQDGPLGEHARKAVDAALAASDDLRAAGVAAEREALGRAANVGKNGELNLAIATVNALSGVLRGGATEWQSKENSDALDRIAVDAICARERARDGEQVISNSDELPILRRAMLGGAYLASVLVSEVLPEVDGEAQKDRVTRVAAREAEVACASLPLDKGEVADAIAGRFKSILSDRSKLRSAIAAGPDGVKAMDDMRSAHQATARVTRGWPAIVAGCVREARKSKSVASYADIAKAINDSVTEEQASDDKAPKSLEQKLADAEKALVKLAKEARTAGANGLAERIAACRAYGTAMRIFGEVDREVSATSLAATLATGAGKVIQPGSVSVDISVSPIVPEKQPEPQPTAAPVTPDVVATVAANKAKAAARRRAQASKAASDDAGE